MVNRPKRILIVRTDRIGDVVLSTPVIKNLKIAYPESYIAFICRPYTREVLEGNPNLDEVIVYDKYGKDKSFLATLRFSSYLKRKKFDWAIILHPTNRANLITFLAGIPLRVGWNRKLGFLLTKRLKHEKQEGKKHELEYNLDVLKSMGIKAERRDTFFPINKASEEKIEELFRGHAINENDKVIVVHPSASCRSKRWPIKYFQELIDLLRKEINFKLMVVTSEKEKKFAQALVMQNQVIDLRGKLNISELGSLFRRTTLFISNDSGPVHVAASLETPVISIFGRSDSGLSPARWRPLGRFSAYFHKEAGCEVCSAHDCKKDFQCLKNITPEEVAAKALSICRK